MQLPGFEATEEPKEDDDDEVLPHPTKKEPKIAKFKAEDLDRNLISVPPPVSPPSYSF